MRRKDIKWGGNVAYVTKPARRTSELVRETIERDGVVRLGLARGLINVRALARSIREEAGAEASLDAILGAIRRYPLPVTAARRREVGKAIAKLSLRNRIAVISVRNKPENLLTIARFAGEAGPERTETFRLVAGPETISVTIDSKHVDRLEAKLPRHEVLRRLDDLAELAIEMIPAADEVPGALSAITTELALADVNVVQLSTMGPGRILALFREKDVTEAYRTLERLARTSR